MRKVIYAMSVSLDGFIEATNGDLGWSFPDEELHKHFNDARVRLWRLPDPMSLPPNCPWARSPCSAGMSLTLISSTKVWRRPTPSFTWLSTASATQELEVVFNSSQSAPSDGRLRGQTLFVVLLTGVVLTDWYTRFALSHRALPQPLLALLPIG